MLEDTVKDYSPYLKLNICDEIGGVQSVVDNMLTRLEEFESVLHMIKMKNDDCVGTLSGEIEGYRNEISALSKKIDTLEEVVSKVRNNLDLLEKTVEKAEADFGVSTDNKLKMFLKPFLNRHKETNPAPAPVQPVGRIQVESVLGYFEEK